MYVAVVPLLVVILSSCGKRETCDRYGSVFPTTEHGMDSTRVHIAELYSTKTGVLDIYWGNHFPGNGGGGVDFTTCPSATRFHSPGVY